jgi:hypothetical protein
MASGAALMLASASLTISIIGAASPPLSAYLSAEQRVLQWVASLTTLVFAVLASAQVWVRRPLLTTIVRARRWPRVSAAQMTGLSIFGGIAIVSALGGLFMALGSIRADQGRAVTDSMSFWGIGIPLGVMANVCSVVAVTLFVSWWQRSPPVEVDGVAPRGQ